MMDIFLRDGEEQMEAGATMNLFLREGAEQRRDGATTNFLLRDGSKQLMEKLPTLSPHTGDIVLLDLHQRRGGLAQPGT